MNKLKESVGLKTKSNKNQPTSKPGKSRFFALFFTVSKEFLIFVGYFPRLLLQNVDNFY